MTALTFGVMGGLSAPFLFLCRPVVAETPPEPAKRAAPTTWPKCLWCECDAGDGFFYSYNLCPACFGPMPRARRKACEAMTERWRKWHRRECYIREAWFDGPPSPWQLDVYRLAQRIGLGEHSEPFDPKLHTELDATRRARAEALPEGDRVLEIQSVHERLGLTRAEVRLVLKGEIPPPADAKGKLLDNVRVWFSTLREAS